MIIAVDFDGTIVEYVAPGEALRLRPYVDEGLASLKRAGHTLILYSSRSCPALWADWKLNNLWESGALPFHQATWERNRERNKQRNDQMQAFIEKNFPGVFEGTYVGMGKPPQVDLFIDDRACVLGAHGIDWKSISRVWGQP